MICFMLSNLWSDIPYKRAHHRLSKYGFPPPPYPWYSRILWYISPSSGFFSHEYSSIKVVLRSSLRSSIIQWDEYLCSRGEPYLKDTDPPSIVYFLERLQPQPQERDVVHGNSLNGNRLENPALGVHHVPLVTPPGKCRIAPMRHQVDPAR